MIQINKGPCGINVSDQDRLSANPPPAWMCPLEKGQEAALSAGQLPAWQSQLLFLCVELVQIPYLQQKITDCDPNLDNQS